MARVKILLESGETELDADQALQKALDHHTGGGAHDEEAFDDPAMVHMAERLEDAHNRIYNDMIREISGVLDEGYSHGGE